MLRQQRHLLQNENQRQQRARQSCLHQVDIDLIRLYLMDKLEFEYNSNGHKWENVDGEFLAECIRAFRRYPNFWFQLPKFMQEYGWKKRMWQQSDEDKKYISKHTEKFTQRAPLHCTSPWSPFQQGLSGTWRAHTSDL